MRKAALKRIKITKNGKMLYRHAGHNHFNARASRRVQLQHKNFQSFSKALEKKMQLYIL